MFKRLIIAPAILAVIILSGTLSPPPRTHTVTLRSNGLEPEELTVKRGDKVRFVNATNIPFSPASDPHPTHEFLSGFDAGGPVLKNSSWSFVFKEGGVWPYHNHLSPSVRGEVTVLGNNSEGIAEIDCEGGGEKDKGQCFDEKIKNALEKEGIEAAFKLFAELYQKGDAPESCHWTGHFIGEEAYHLYKEGKDVPITQATSYCGYAFYHGFLESLLRDNPDVEWARSFCEYVGGKLGESAQDNCFHGIGHGFTEDPPDPRLWGNAKAMLEPGLEVCEYLYGDTENKWEICATGVYTVIAGFMWNNKYKLSLDPNDPFEFCRNEPERYRIACYGEFAPMLDRATNWDVSKLSKYIKNISDHNLASYVVRVASGVMMQRDVAKEDLSNYIHGCRTLPGDLPFACIGGIAWGMVTHSAPGKEHVYALRLCGGNVLKDEERDVCYKEALQQLRRSLPLADLKAICGGLAEKYRPYCVPNP